MQRKIARLHVSELGLQYEAGILCGQDKPGSACVQPAWSSCGTWWELTGFHTCLFAAPRTLHTSLCSKTLALSDGQGC